MDQKTRKVLYLLGIKCGCIASFVGSLIFLILEILWLLINNSQIELTMFSMLAFVMLALGSLFVSIAPTVFGTIILVFRIYELMKSGTNTNRPILYEGVKVGFFVGLGICVFITFTFLYRSEIWVIIIQTVIATSISIFIAGITALKIKKDIQYIGSLN